MGWLTRLFGPRTARKQTDRPWVPVSSSNLEAVQYVADPKADKGTMRIRFLQGRTYEYLNVPVAVYLGLMKAPSKGKYHHANIKWAYPYKRV